MTYVLNVWLESRNPEIVLHWAKDKVRRLLLSDDICLEDLTDVSLNVSERLGSVKAL